MIRNWHTGHSLGVGLLGGLLLTGHVWTVAFVCFAAGLFVGRFWATLAALTGRFTRYALTSRSRTPW